MNRRLLFIAAFLAAVSLYLDAEVAFEGDISLGSSYNSNIGRLSGDDLSQMGVKKSDNDAFSVDLDAFLTLTPVGFFSLEYSLFTAVTPEDISYSFFNHSLAALFSHELEKVDISYGVEVGHLLVGFNNRLLDPQVLFDLFWYADEWYSYYLSAAVSYVAGLDSDYSYLTAPGFRFENGIYIYPVKDRNFIALGVGERMFFFDEDYFPPAEPPDPPEGEIWAQRGFSETYLRVKGKYFYRGFSVEASARYGFTYYMKPDRWQGAMIPFFPPQPSYRYEKTRMDHAIRLKALLEYRFTDLISLIAYYSYLRNFSNVGANSIDYENDSFDQHTTGIMVRFVF